VRRAVREAAREPGDRGLRDRADRRVGDTALPRTRRGVGSPRQLRRCSRVSPFRFESTVSAWAELPGVDALDRSAPAQFLVDPTPRRSITTLRAGGVRRVDAPGSISRRYTSKRTRMLAACALLPLGSPHRRPSGRARGKTNARSWILGCEGGWTRLIPKQLEGWT
jgi:hypothetical protein